MIINILPLQAFAEEREAYYETAAVEETTDDIFGNETEEDDIPQTTVKQEEQAAIIKPVIEKILDDYAREVYQPNAGSDAIDQLGMRAIYGKGKDLKLNKESPTTAAVFNTNLFKYSVSEAVTATIIKMQEMSMEYGYLHGGSSWRSYGNSYAFGVYSDYNEEERHEHYMGTIIDNNYYGPLNRNDAAMKYCIGALTTDIHITEKQRENNVITYGIKIKISDEYNFDGEYGNAENDGFDTDFEDLLTGFGSLINGTLIKSFYWEFITEELTIEVPVFYNCNHVSASYRWEYDFERDLLYTAPTGNFRNIEIVFQSWN